MADIVDDLHWIERLAAGIGRAYILASSARSASPTIDKVAPCEVGVVHRPEGFDVQVIKQNCLPIFSTCQRFHGCHWAHVMEEHVRESHDQVHVL